MAMGKLRLQGSLQDTVKVSGKLGKRRARPIYKITDMFKYDKK
jgi:hypothetical protein